MRDHVGAHTGKGIQHRAARSRPLVQHPRPQIDANGVVSARRMPHGCGARPRRKSRIAVVLHPVHCETMPYAGGELFEDAVRDGAPRSFWKFLCESRQELERRVTRIGEERLRSRLESLATGKQHNAIPRQGSHFFSCDTRRERCAPGTYTKARARFGRLGAACKQSTNPRRMRSCCRRRSNFRQATVSKARRVDSGPSCPAPVAPWSSSKSNRTRADHSRSARRTARRLPPPRWCIHRRSNPRCARHSSESGSCTDPTKASPRSTRWRRLKT